MYILAVTVNVSNERRFFVFVWIRVFFLCFPQILLLVYQITDKCAAYSANKRNGIKDDSKTSMNQHTAVMAAIRKKVDEESVPHDVGTIPDRYDPDDDSYLKKLPNLTEAMNQSKR